MPISKLNLRHGIDSYRMRFRSGRLKLYQSDQYKSVHTSAQLLITLTSKCFNACLFTVRPQLQAPHFKHIHNVRSYSKSLFSICSAVMLFGVVGFAQSLHFSASNLGNLHALRMPAKSTARLMCWQPPFWPFPGSLDESDPSCGSLCRFFFTIDGRKFILQ